LQRGLRVPELHAHHHQVDDADLRRIVGRANVLQMKRVGAALDAKPVAAHRLKMLTTGDETNVGATPCQQAAKIAAEASRSHYRHTHREVSNYAVARWQAWIIAPGAL
jgi:hypothetical protein